MRYADGGRLTAEGRARREAVRLQAAEMFAQDADPVQIARSLRVSTKSVYQWRRAWRAGGQEALALASRGPGGSPCRLDEGQLEQQLRAAPRCRQARPRTVGRGPAVTLTRAASLATRLFGVCYTLRGMSFLLHCLGFSPQVPAHRAFERDEAAIAKWRSPGPGHEASGADRRVDLLRVAP